MIKILLNLLQRGKLDNSATTGSEDDEEESEEDEDDEDDEEEDDEEDMEVNDFITAGQRSCGKVTFLHLSFYSGVVYDVNSCLVAWSHFLSREEVMSFPIWLPGPIFLTGGGGSSSRM